MFGRRAGMDVPERIGQALFDALPGIVGKMGEIVIDGARYDVEKQPLGRFRLDEHIKRQTLR